MNIVRWNDQWITKRPIFVSGFWDAIKIAPLFEHDCGSEDWSIENFPHVFDGFLPKMPFNCLRLSAFNTLLPPKSNDMGMEKFIERFGKDGAMKPFHFGINVVAMRMDDAIMMVSRITFIKFFGITRRDYGEVICISKAYAYKKWITGSFFDLNGNQIHTVPDESIKLFEQFRDWGFEVVQKFCIDYMNPHFHPIEVSPKAMGRSVEWRRQRSHFILVHKTHSANRAGASGIINHNGADSVARMAHARRAHFRILRSERFKAKRGQQIFIKSCWVGPKEWEDASGQTYKLVDKKIPQITD